ncbi:hypothetical protein LP420_09310 [Massilia sp. B-10]|nr:hypothetical protein LP420_09310 [Massilia sp. B-10]
MAKQTTLATAYGAATHGVSPHHSMAHHGRGEGYQGEKEHDGLLMRGNFKCMPLGNVCPNIPRKPRIPVADWAALCDICLLNKIKLRTMKSLTRTALLLAPLLLVACGKKEAETAAPAVLSARPG